LLVAGLQYVSAAGPRTDGFCRVGGQITSDIFPLAFEPQPLNNQAFVTAEECFNECVSDYTSQYTECASLFGPPGSDPRPCYCQLNTKMLRGTNTPVGETKSVCWSPLAFDGIPGFVDTWTGRNAYPAECGQPSYGCRTDICGTNANSTCCAAFDPAEVVNEVNVSPVCTIDTYISVPAGLLCNLGYKPGEFETYKCCLPGYPDGGTGDPHLHFAHGGRADVRGQPGAHLNFLSARNVSLNVRMAASDFHWSKRLIHGTHIDAAFWTLRTSENKLIKIAFESTKPSRANVTLISSGSAHERASVVHEGAQALQVDNVEVALAERVLTVMSPASG